MVIIDEWLRNNGELLDDRVVIREEWWFSRIIRDMYVHKKPNEKWNDQSKNRYATIDVDHNSSCFENVFFNRISTGLMAINQLPNSVIH